MKDKGLLRYSVDVWSILMVVSVLCVQFAALALDWGWWFLVPLILLLRQTNLVEHNHAHLRIFHSRALNEAFGWMCFLSNGVPLEFYEVHHVDNHHRHNNTDEDWSSIFAFKGCRFPDRAASMPRYILTFPHRTMISSLRWIMGHPERKMYRRFWTSVGVVGVVSAGLVAINPVGFVKFFAIPWLGIFFGLGFTSYRHHLNCEFTSPYDSSNVMRGIPFEILGFNIGFHVSHHMKPALHWSLLPEHHESIEHLIPDHHFLAGGRIRPQHEAAAAVATPAQESSSHIV